VTRNVTYVVGASLRPSATRTHWTTATVGGHTQTVLVILMTMSETLSLAEVKAHLSELVGRVNRQHERVTVTVHGRPSAVLVAVDDLEALEETIAVLSDNEALRQIAASDAELVAGKGEGAEELAAAMDKRRQSSS
jgi:antitoxin YefM